MQRRESSAKGLAKARKNVFRSQLINVRRHTATRLSEEHRDDVDLFIFFFIS
jgi:hypothetical protein